MGKVLQSTAAPVLMAAPRPPVTAGPASPGLRASFGFGDAAPGTPRPTRAPSRVQAGRLPLGTIVRCRDCGAERPVMSRTEVLDCRECGSDRLQPMGRAFVKTVPGAVADDALPGLAPRTTAPAAKRQKWGASGWSDPTGRGRSTSRPLEMLRKRTIWELIAGV